MAKPEPLKTDLLLELHRQLAVTKELVHAATRQMNIDLAMITKRLGALEQCATTLPTVMARLEALETRSETKRAAKKLKRKTKR